MPECVDSHAQLGLRYAVAIPSVMLLTGGTGGALVICIAPPGTGPPPGAPPGAPQDGFNALTKVRERARDSRCCAGR